MITRAVWPVGVVIAVLTAAYAGWHGAALAQVPPVLKPSATMPAQPAPRAHAPGDEQRCVKCHEALADGHLRTRFGERRLKPTTPWLGMAHDRDWIVRHRWVAADRGTLCATCHQERECTQCHDGRSRPRMIHPNDWLTLHPQHARRSATDCQGCHSLQTFCTECHARLGISQLAASGTRTGVRIHPPAAQWTGIQNQHAREAQRSLSTCVSCHAEQDCVRCHAAGAPGNVQSPHPRGFRDRCGSLLQANARACSACHGADLATIRLMCAP
jgi:hypothetical protein